MRGGHERQRAAAGLDDRVGELQAAFDAWRTGTGEGRTPAPPFAGNVSGQGPGFAELPVPRATPVTVVGIGRFGDTDSLAGTTYTAFTLADAQRLLDEQAHNLERALATSTAVTVDEAAQTAPIADLWQASHDRLYSRLFQS